jgi:hypothetical protein
LARTARWELATTSPRRMRSGHLQLVILCRPIGAAPAAPSSHARDGPQRAGPRSSHSQALRRDVKTIPSRPPFAANRASNPVGRLRGSSAPRRRRNRSTTGPSMPEPSFFTPQAPKKITLNQTLRVVASEAGEHRVTPQLASWPQDQAIARDRTRTAAFRGHTITPTALPHEHSGEHDLPGNPR